MPIPQPLVDFDVENSTVSVWLYRKSAGAGGIPKFTGRWIETDEQLDETLKAAIAHERARIVEVNEYSLLAQNNESSALRIDVLETHAGLVAEQAAGEATARKISDLKHVQNTDFYVVKLVSGDDILYVVRKTDSSWQSKRAKSVISVFFKDDRLGLDATPSFSISRHVDFFIIQEHVIILSKGNFESVLNYKQAHAQDFANLQDEEEFIGLFTTVGPIVEFIGTNKIHLRRACAIHAKGHYKDPAFMTKLRRNCVRCGLNLQFDAAGQIVPTPETCADIIRALLDHRLLSPFSDNLYDVPEATVVH
jgi:hypothetical protein